MKWGSLVLLLLVIALTESCDIFSTRTPDPPDSGTNFIWTPATSVDYLITNFTGSLQLLDATNYTRVFVSATDSAASGTNKVYQFNYTPGLDQSSRTVFAGWNVESERVYVSKLKTSLPTGSKLTVLLSNKHIDQTASTATVTMDYSVIIPVDAATSLIPAVVSGSMTLQLVLVTTEQSAKEWRVATWSDFAPQNAGTATWTNLKVKLSS